MTIGLFVIEILLAGSVWAGQLDVDLSTKASAVYDKCFQNALHKKKDAMCVDETLPLFARPELQAIIKICGAAVNNPKMQKEFDGVISVRHWHFANDWNDVKWDVKYMCYGDSLKFLIDEAKRIKNSSTDTLEFKAAQIGHACDMSMTFKGAQSECLKVAIPLLFMDFPNLEKDWQQKKNRDFPYSYLLRLYDPKNPGAHFGEVDPGKVTESNAAK